MLFIVEACSTRGLNNTYIMVKTIRCLSDLGSATFEKHFVMNLHRYRGAVHELSWYSHIDDLFSILYLLDRNEIL